MSERGFVNLSVIIAAVLGIGFAASAYLNFAQHQQAQGEQTLLQGQITDLTYQIKQDRLAEAVGTTSSPLPTPTASATSTPPSPSPAASTAPTKTATVKIQGNIHQTADPRSKVLVSYAKVPVGASITLGANASGGYQQITFNGTTGYIESSDLQ